MSIIFPLTLPKARSGSFVETLPINIIRTDMEQGPSKIRRLSTSKPTNIRFTLFLDSDQVEILREFFINTTLAGSETFEFTHPNTSKTYSSRFLNPPEIKHVEYVYSEAVINIELISEIL